MGQSHKERYHEQQQLAVKNGTEAKALKAMREAAPVAAQEQSELEKLRRQVAELTAAVKGGATPATPAAPAPVEADLQKLVTDAERIRQLERELADAKKATGQA